MNLVFTSKKTSFINQKKIIKKEINYDLEKPKNIDNLKPTLPNILNHIKRGKKGGCSACGH